MLHQWKEMTIFTFSNNQRMELSVIIPVYQTAATLERCVRSVTASPCPDNMEIILVDDGSTDGSAALCDRIASADSRVKVIHRSNGGLSAARNTGLDTATGSYIAFIDSDDEYLPGTLLKNMNILTADDGIGLAEFPVSVHHGSQRQYIYSPEPRTVCGDRVLADWIAGGGNRHAYACNKIFRRELFDRTRFPEGETFEDIAIMPHIIGNCRKVCYSGQGMYLYYDNSDGITAHYRFHRQEPLFRHNLELLEKVRKTVPERRSVALWCCCLNLLADLCRCHDSDTAYTADAASRLDAYRPSAIWLPFSGVGFKDALKFAAAATCGSRKICTRLGKKKLPL